MYAQKIGLGNRHFALTLRTFLDLTAKSQRCKKKYYTNNSKHKRFEIGDQRFCYPSIEGEGLLLKTKIAMGCREKKQGAFIPYVSTIEPEKITGGKNMSNTSNF